LHRRTQCEPKDGFRLLGLIVPLVQDAGAFPKKVGSGFPRKMRSNARAFPLQLSRNALFGAIRPSSRTALDKGTIDLVFNHKVI